LTKHKDVDNFTHLSHWGVVSKVKMKLILSLSTVWRGRLKYMADNSLVNMVEQIRKQAIQDLYDGKLNYDATISLLKRQVAIVEKSGNYKIAGNVYNTLAIIELEVGNYPAARQQYEQAIAMFEAGNEQAGLAAALCGLGELHRETGNVEDASKCYRKSREIALTVDDKKLVIYNFCNEGQLWLGVGQLERAIELLEGGIDLAQNFQPWTANIRNQVMPEMLSALGQANAKLRDFKRAWQCVNRALELSTHNQELHQMAHAYEVMAFIGVQQELPAHEIATYFQKSLELWKRLGAMADLGRVRSQEGAYWLSQGKTAEAIAAYQEASVSYDTAKLHAEAEEARLRVVALSQ
jgi:tetratricopeptide (TPR) repeat protein